VGIGTLREVRERRELIVAALPLLFGLHRLIRPGGALLLTTNSVGFIGDIARLLVGRHNVAALELSHVVSNSDWQPHIRLFTMPELRTLIERAGFEVDAAYYFDNGNVCSGAKGAAMTALTRPARPEVVCATGRRPDTPKSPGIIARASTAPPA